MTTTQLSATFARLTRSAPACYSEPVHIPVGSGFSTQLPPGDGIVTKRWSDSAAALADAVIDPASGSCLQYVHLDDNPQGWIQIHCRLPDLPATCLLTHPRLAQQLCAEVEIICDGAAAFYIRGDEVQACPLPLAVHRDSWHGPLDLRTGFCVTFSFH